MFYFIYKTTNLINGKFYIGQHRTNNLDDGYIGSGTLFTKAVKKYGKENFRRSIITFAVDGEQLNRLEEAYVTPALLDKDACYNLVTGGYNNVVFSEHTRKLLSSKNTGKNNPWYGKKHSNETIKRITEASKKRRFSEACKKERSRHFKAYYNIEAHRIAISRKHGIVPFTCIETGEIFNTVKEAADKLHVDRSNISRVLSGERLSTHNLHFKFQ